VNDPASDADADPDAGSDCAGCARHLEAGTRFCAGCGRSATGSDELVEDVGTTGVMVGSPRVTRSADATSSIERVPQGRVGAEQGSRPGAATSDASTPDTSTPDATSISAATAVATCSACGAVNASSRMLCGACGLDLDTGDPQLTVEPAPAVGMWSSVETAPRERGERAAIPWWVPAVLALLVLVAVAAAIVSLGLGPFEASGDLPTAEFEASDYPGDPEPLTLTDVATLTLQPPVGGRTFTPEHLVDGNPETAWHGDASALPTETDEKIDLILDRPAWVTGVVIDNGDQVDAQAYASTSRVQRALMVFDGDVRVPVTLLDQGLSPQIVEFEEPLLSSAVRIEILETVAGTDLEEVAISRLEVLGFPAEGDDVALAEERRARMPAAGAISIPG
jgi:hypothetical protein